MNDCHLKELPSDKLVRAVEIQMSLGNSRLEVTMSQGSEFSGYHSASQLEGSIFRGSAFRGSFLGGPPPSHAHARPRSPSTHGTRLRFPINFQGH